MQEYLPDFDFKSLGGIIFLCLCSFAFLQLIFLLFIYGRVSFHKVGKGGNRDFKPPISIIIAARNESENLYQFLPFILEQDYPEFEVIVINHQSIDDSKYILQAIEIQYKHLRTIHIEKNNHMKFGKKLPLTIGIKGAKYEHLIFTDADCQPLSNQWLNSMASYFNDSKKIVMGYGPYRRRKGFINRLIRFDTAWIAMSYLGFAKSRMPYMGIGRNLAYTKEVFENVNGFKSHYGLSSGDDDLFIQEATHNSNYTINLEPESFCRSKAAANLDLWMQQKARHYTTSERYGVIKKLMLGIYPLSLLLMLGSFVSLLFDEEYIWISLAVFTFLIIIKWIVLGKAFSKLKEHKFIPWILFWDIFYAIWTPIMYYSVSNSDKDKW